MKIIIQNQLSELSKVNDIIDEIAKPWNLSIRTTSQLSLVLDELLANIIQYAFKDKNVHDLEVRLDKADDKLQIEVIDDGIEFNPLFHSEPDLNPNLAERKVEGLGIHIIKKWTNEFSYDRKDGYNIQKFSKILN